MPYWILAVTREVTWALKGQSAVPPSHPTNSVVCSNYSHISHFWKPWKGRTQNTLHNGETLDTLTQVPTPNNQWQLIHSLIPTWLHFSPTLVIASQRTSMHHWATACWHLTLGLPCLHGTWFCRWPRIESWPTSSTQCQLPLHSVQQGSQVGCQCTSVWRLWEIDACCLSGSWREYIHRTRAVW